MLKVAAKTSEDASRGGVEIGEAVAASHGGGGGRRRWAVNIGLSGRGIWFRISAR